MIKLNAGEIVELAVRRQNINISELSRKMNINRRTLYNWFQQENLSSAIIHSISLVINYDFSSEFPEDFFGNITIEGELNFQNSPYDEQEQYYWMKKYIILLEDYKLLLEKINQRNSIMQE